jgi:hypothetical protein
MSEYLGLLLLVGGSHIILILVVCIWGSLIINEIERR